MNLTQGAAHRVRRQPATLEMRDALEEKAFVRRLYWWSFVLRASLAIVAWLVTISGNFPLLQDPLYYDFVGAHIANDWLHGRPSSWLATVGQREHQPVGIVVVIAVFYTLSLGVRILPVLMVIYGAISAFTPVVIYRTARLMGTTRRAARIAGWAVAVSPAFAFFSGALHKEGLILLLLALLLYHTFKLQQQWATRSLFILGVSILALVFLRSYLAAVMACVVVLGITMMRHRARPGEDPTAVGVRQVFVMLMFALAMVGVGIAGELNEIWPEDPSTGFEELHRYRQGSAMFAESGYLPEADISTPSQAVAYLPKGLYYFLTAPLPWQWGRLRQNVVIPDTTFWVLMYPVIFVGVRESLRRNFRASIVPILAAVILCLFYALFVANIGTAYRMRIQVWLMWSIFLGIGWERLAGRPAFVVRRVRRKRFPMMGAPIRTNMPPALRGREAHESAFDSGVQQ